MGSTIKLGIQLNSLEEVRGAFNRYISCKNEKAVLLQHDISLLCDFFRALSNGDLEALKAAANKIKDQPHEGQYCDALLCDKLIYRNSCTFFGSEHDKECDAVDKNFVCTADTIHISHCITSCVATYDSPISANEVIAVANDFAEHQGFTNKMLALCDLKPSVHSDAFTRNSVEDMVEDLCPECDRHADWETFWEQHKVGESYVGIKDEF